MRKIRIAGLIAAAATLASLALLAATLFDDGVSSTPARASSFAPPQSPGCANRTDGQNIRVTQDCGFRNQSEEKIAYDPNAPLHFVAASNDFRTGFNKTSIQWSVDGGIHWGDVEEPFQHKLNFPELELPKPGDPNRHTIGGDPGTGRGYEHCSDPSVAWDSGGRVFYSCVAFDSNFESSLLGVGVSPPGANGSYFTDISTRSRIGIVAEDNNPTIFNDKELLAADTSPSSPNRDNIYIVWTVLPGFGDVFEGPTYAAMSTDHGRTWSTPERINGSSPRLCPTGDSNKSECDRSYAPAPAVLPDGTLVVVFYNHNLPGQDAQYLAVRCHPLGSSPDGTATTHCGNPVKVANVVRTGEPQCDFGSRFQEECVPGPFLALEDDPQLAVQPQSGQLYVAWQDYRNGEYDIQLSRSLNRGASWSPGQTVNPDRNLDHYLPAVAVSPGPDGDRIGVSYYRSQRIPNENTPPPNGFEQGSGEAGSASSDYVLAGGTSSAPLPWPFAVISPTFQPPDQATFIGDYTGLVISPDGRAHPIWADTRNPDPYGAIEGWTRDLDVFTDNVQLPSGNAGPQTGRIGAR